MLPVKTKQQAHSTTEFYTSNGKENFEQERAERAEIATAARKYTQKQGCKLELYYSRKFRVLQID